MHHVRVDNGIVVALDLTGNPPAGYVEAPVFVQPGYLWDGDEWSPPSQEATPPVEVEPARIACALHVPVVDGEVQQIGGSFRVTAMVLMDEGTFLAIFSQDLGSEPYVIPNNGISVAITEWGGDYAMIEVRDHAGGSLITPPSFGFSLYQL